MTVAELCDVFLAAKTRMVEAGQLTSMMFYGYKVVARFLVKQFGANRLVDDFAGDDFATLRAAMAKKWGPVRLANSITCIRSVITYCFDNGHT